MLVCPTSPSIFFNETVTGHHVKNSDDIELLSEFNMGHGRVSPRQVNCYRCLWCPTHVPSSLSM